MVTSTVNAYRIINGQARPHYGTDFGAPTGTPIIAIADGVIEERRRKGSFGNYIQVEHGHGYDTRYAHMSRFEAGLAVGDCVSQGDVIGYVGSTGRSTGPHLHIEIRKHDKALFPRELGLKLAQGFAWTISRRHHDNWPTASRMEIAKQCSSSRLCFCHL